MYTLSICIHYLYKAALSSHFTDLKTEVPRDYVIRPSGARAGIQSRTVCKFCAICYYSSRFCHALNRVTITVAPFDFFSLPPNTLFGSIIKYSITTHHPFWHMGIFPKEIKESQKGRALGSEMGKQKGVRGQLFAYDYTDDWRRENWAGLRG